MLSIIFLLLTNTQKRQDIFQARLLLWKTMPYDTMQRVLCTIFVICLLYIHPPQDYYTCCFINQSNRQESGNRRTIIIIIQNQVITVISRKNLVIDIVKIDKEIFSIFLLTSKDSSLF